jgi:hypothetical protein
MYQQYFSGPIHWSFEYRSPWAQPTGSVWAMAWSSAGLNVNAAPFANSLK